LIAISVARDAAARSRSGVILALHDTASGVRVTVTMTRGAAASLMAVLLAATAPDSEDFDADFQLKGTIT
jgi:hypothetical protein